MNTIQTFQNLPPELRHPIIKGLVNNWQLKWEVEYEVREDNKPRVIFTVPYFRDDNRHYLARLVSKWTGRATVTPQENLKYLTSLEDSKRLVKTRHILQVRLLDCLTLIPQELMSTLRALTFLFRSGAIQQVEFQIWNQSGRKSWRYIQHISLDDFVALVGPCIAKNPHNVLVTFDPSDRPKTRLERSMVVPWAQTRFKINPKFLDVHKAPDFHTERTTIFDLNPSNGPWDNWSACLGPEF